MGVSEGARRIDKQVRHIGLGCVIQGDAFAGSAGAGFDVGVDADYFRVVCGGAGKAERGGQVIGAKGDGVETFDGEDGVEIVVAQLRFDLGEDQHIVVGELAETRASAIGCEGGFVVEFGAAATAPGALAQRREVAGIDQGPGLVGSLDMWCHNALDAAVEPAVDFVGADVRYASGDREAVGVGDVDDAIDIGGVEGAVLTVEIDGVEAGAGGVFDQVGIGKGQVQAQGLFALLVFGEDGVGKHIHQLL